jgi:hypothetical protein
VADLRVLNRDADLHRLLALEIPGAGTNAWYEAHADAGELSGYIEDVNSAWEVAEIGGNGPPEGERVGWQCRYAFITGSLRSISSTLPPQLLGLMLERGAPRWSPAWGLAQAERQEGEEQRAAALGAIAAHLPPTLLPGALELVGTITDPARRAAAVASLLGALDDIHSAFEQALALPDDLSMTRTMIELGPRLPEALAQEALARAPAIEDEWARGNFLTALVPSLPPAERRQLLALSAAIDRADVRGALLAELIPKLAPESLEDASAQVHSLAIEARPDSLQALLGALDPRRRSEELAEYMAHIDTLAADPNADSPLAGLIVALVPYAEGAQLNTLARLAATLPHKAPAVWALATIRARLGPQASAAERQLVAATRGWLRPAGRRSPQVNYQILAWLAPRLPPAERELALRAALSEVGLIADAGPRAEAIAVLVPVLPAPVMTEVLPVALQTAEALPRPRTLLIALAEHATEQTRPALLLKARSLHVEDGGAEVLAALASGASGEQRTALADEALAAATHIGDADDQGRLFAALAGDPAAASGRPDAPERPEPGRETADADALAQIGELEDEQRRAEALAEIAPRLPDALLPAAVEIAGTIGHVVPKPEYTGFLDPVIGDEPSRARALVAVAPRLSGQPAQRALELASAIADPTARASALTALALPPGGTIDAAAVREAVDAAAQIQSEGDAVEAFCELAPVLERLPTELVLPIWRQTLRALARWSRPALLEGLVDFGGVVESLGGPDAHATVAAAVAEVCRWFP